MQQAPTAPGAATPAAIASAAAPAETEAGAESAAPSATGQSTGTVKLNGAITVSYVFSPTCAIRGADATKMGLAPGYILGMTPGGNINSGTIIVTDYSKDDVYDETARLSSTPGQTLTWSPLDLNFALRPGGPQHALAPGKGSSLKVSISKGGTEGSATFTNFSVSEGPVSGSITWTCAQVQR